MCVRERLTLIRACKKALKSEAAFLWKRRGCSVNIQLYVNAHIKKDETIVDLPAVFFLFYLTGVRCFAVFIVETLPSSPADSCN